MDQNPRILIIDDTRAIHDDFRKILGEDHASGMDAATAALFGGKRAIRSRAKFMVDCASQGDEGLAMVQLACQQGQPYSVAFVDGRMPPGWDGIESTEKLWLLDPELQVVLCTAYADYSWDEIIERLGTTDGLVILKKPFDYVEVLQLAHALSKKWQLARQYKAQLANLGIEVSQRTQELEGFSELGHRLSSARTTREAARIIVDVADRLLGWDSCFCDLYSASRGVQLEILNMDTVNGRRVECPPIYAPGESSALGRKVIEEGGQLVLRDSTAGLQPLGRPFGDTSRLSASLLYVPIRDGAETIGVLSIQSYTPKAYDQSSLRLLQSLAGHCGGALARIRNHETLLETEARLHHSQKLEAIGQLAGGVAHDFNNLLAVIRGNTELLLMNQESLNPEATDGLKQVIEASDRAAGLTRQLLAFGRKQVMQAQPLNLCEVISNLAKMLKRIIGEDIQLRSGYAPGLPLVHADAGMMEQVLVNLAVNARDAMPEGGQLLLGAEAVCFKEADLPNHPEARVGQFVCLSVTDSGSGIATEHLSHIFEPFFTTKEFGKGTGLGLATAYGIIKQHQGWIEVFSRLGQGSTFKVFLPVAAEVHAETSKPTPKAEPGRGDETILLVEDDEAVRSLTRRVLEKSGYRILQASSGREALEMCRDRLDEIDLLVTDVVMPRGVSGCQLAEQLLARRPALKTIFLTGYGGQVIGQDASFIRIIQGRLLHKPCSRLELLQTIRQSLDGSG